MTDAANRRDGLRPGASPPPPSRRALIAGIAAAGGLPAAAAAIAALAPAPAAAAAAAPRLPGRPWRVAVLGAGIAGLSAALPMRRAGWPVTLLEATDRAGGRCRTLRAGDVVREDGQPEQRVGWDAAPHLWFNPGPARIPHHHRALLGLCRELGVALEPLVNENRAALLHAGGPAVPLRRVAADLRGTVAELAAKALDRTALDAPFTDADLDALRAMLRGFGALDADLRYRGTRRAGWAAPPGAAAPGRPQPPLDPRLLLDPSVWATAGFAEGVDYAATMLQPAGGMDRIAAAMHAALGDAVRLGCEVVSLRRTADGEAVDVAWREAGAVRQARFDRVLCTLPPPLLAALDTDFAAERRAVLRALRTHPAGKLAFHAPRRFWEEDAAIYGGISWTTGDVSQLWYPSHGFHAAGGGILLGAYLWDEALALRFAARTPAERAAAAAAEGEALHPRYAGEVGQAVSVSWPRMPLARGAWTEWTEAQRRASYAALRAPEGPYHFAGEHFSYLPGWQEGAVLSAWAAADAMAAG
jgi:monoamine oxidase